MTKAYAEARFPREARIVFHNTEPQFTFGGWLPPARLADETHADLVWSFGAVYHSTDRFESRIKLEATRRMGWHGIGAEKLESFVARVFTEAAAHIDEARYLRCYHKSDRVDILARRISHLLKENGCEGAEAAWLQSNRNGWMIDRVAALVQAPAQHLERVSTTLTVFGLRMDGRALPSELRRTAPLPGTFCSIPGQILWFDDVPIVMYPKEDQDFTRSLREVEPDCFRGMPFYFVPEFLEQELRRTVQEGCEIVPALSAQEVPLPRLLP